MDRRGFENIDQQETELEIKNLNLRKLDRRIARKIILKDLYKGRGGDGAVVLEMLSETEADDLEKNLFYDGLEVIKYIDGYLDYDCEEYAYTIIIEWEKTSLSDKKKIVKKIYEILERYLGEYAVYTNR
jgi:hypothetical protein